MGSITDDVDTAAKWVAVALTRSGYKADFSPASLWEIDRFFDEHSQDGQAIPGGLLSEQLGTRIFAIGSYVGEVLRQALGGKWVGDDNDPEAEINVELHLADGGTCWPTQRAMKRFKNGSEDGIATYGYCMGLDVGPWPGAVKKRPWWKFGR
jgi:hypothetical protein